MFRDYRIFLNKTKDTLPSMEDMMKFYVQTNKKEFGNNLKLYGCPSDLKNKSKEVVT